MEFCQNTSLPTTRAFGVVQRTASIYPTRIPFSHFQKDEFSKLTELEAKLTSQEENNKQMLTALNT